MALTSQPAGSDPRRDRHVPRPKFLLLAVLTGWASSHVAFLAGRPWKVTARAVRRLQGVQGKNPGVQIKSRHEGKLSFRTGRRAGPEASTSEAWLDCNLQFLGEEARAAEAKRIEEEMQKAAEAMNFERAQALKMQLASMEEAGTRTAAPPETWLLQAEEFPDFGKFLQGRGVQPKDVSIECEQGGPVSWGGRKCSECMKLNTGGPYGKAGVVSPAYPTQEESTGCLAQSKQLDVSLEEFEGTGVLETDSFDGSEAPASHAFCRTEPL
eukprot:TRINITY_DN85565_c0_g1_i1.p1 TRINITY_DN85565_c0_g1~~TRINITY_DN85565_c0_g1_i1.p1  ORF type:complete len:276 (+),score=61.02 TRINITY_DN85565_c0_g1_i1:27-830(+)